MRLPQSQLSCSDLNTEYCAKVHCYLSFKHRYEGVTSAQWSIVQKCKHLMKVVRTSTEECFSIKLVRIQHHLNAVSKLNKAKFSGEWCWSNIDFMLSHPIRWRQNHRPMTSHYHPMTSHFRDVCRFTLDFCFALFVCLFLPLLWPSQVYCDDFVCSSSHTVLSPCHHIKGNNAVRNIHINEYPSVKSSPL